MKLHVLTAACVFLSSLEEKFCIALGKPLKDLRASAVPSAQWV